MRPRGLAVVCVGAALVAACNVPIESFHRADAGGDAATDVSTDASTDASIDGPGHNGLAQQAYVKASNTGAGDAFGQSVALSADGSTLAVGAFREASRSSDPADDSAADAGAVYVFTRSGAVWTQQAYVKASNAGADDFFGESVALSADGSTLAVGAFSEDSKAIGVGGDQNDETAPAAGAVYVFTRSGTVWTQQAYVKASNTGAGDAFGRSVTLSADGSTLAVGAALEDSDGTSQSNNSAADAGAVYVFTRSGTMWTQEAYVKPSGPIAFDQFGVSVALSGDGSTLAVGASSDASAITNFGKAYVFTRSGTTWTEQLKQFITTTGPIGAFGNSVALSDNGSTLAVGASREDSAGMSAGAAYVFTRSGTAWTQEAHIEASNPGAGDSFGQSVALSADGLTLAVGASFEDSKATGIDGQADELAPDAGAVYVLARSGTAWNQQAYVKASNTGAGDNFGQSVALSGDGATLAVGAFSEDSKATGSGGDQTDDSAGNAGAVYIFR